MTKTVTTGKATDLITFTRSTTGTYLDSVKYGDELVTNGTFDTDSDWGDPQNNWTISDGVASMATTPSYTPFFQYGLGTEQGKRYVLTFDVIALDGNLKVDTCFPDGGGIGNDTYYVVSTTGRHTWYFTGATGSDGIGMSRHTVASSCTIDNVSVKEVIGNQGTSGEPLLRTADTNEPRIEYDADGNLKGLLIEEQKTNNVTQSEDLTTWSKASGGAVVANQTIAPDGTKTADEMVGVVYKTPNTGSGTRAFSVFLKAKAGTTAQVRIDVPASQRITVDLTDGSVLFSTGSSLDSYGVVDVGNGWYRCHIVVTDSINNYVIVGEANDASHTIYAWGAQLETGSFPTSYIPTSGSTVTRNSDAASIAKSNWETNDTEFTLVAESQTFAPDNSATRCICLFGQSTQERILLYYSGATGDTILQVRDDNTISASLNRPSQTNVEYKAAYSLKENDADLSVSGTESIVSDDTVVIPDENMHTLHIGRYHNNSQHLNGHIKSITYYPLKLTNDQLKALTQ